MNDRMTERKLFNKKFITNKWKIGIDRMEPGEIIEQVSSVRLKGDYSNSLPKRLIVLK